MIIIARWTRIEKAVNLVLSALLANDARKCISLESVKILSSKSLFLLIFHFSFFKGLENIFKRFSRVPQVLKFIVHALVNSLYPDIC